MVFEKGDPVPYFSCPSTSNPNYQFDTVAGRYIILSFFASANIEESKKIIHFFTTEMREMLNDKDLAFFGVSTDPEDRSLERVQQQLPGIRYFWDFDFKVSALYHAVDPKELTKKNKKGKIKYYQHTLILDRNLSVVANIPIDDPNKHNEEVYNFITSLPESIIEKDSPQHAPVLIIPRVFEKSFCKELISLYQQEGGTASGFMTESDGYTVARMDDSFKRRKDFMLSNDTDHKELREIIKNKIIRRLVPEVLKAYQFKATYIERYLVACYDSTTGGFFNAHRDNTTKGTAHRRFAVSINLNAEEYEGGNLCFPEYGDKSYRPPTGGAVVFSCSLLHEALPVTKGQRFVFLPFLYDESGKEIRNKNLKYLKPDED